MMNLFCLNMKSVFVMTSRKELVLIISYLSLNLFAECLSQEKAIRMDCRSHYLILNLCLVSGGDHSRTTLMEKLLPMRLNLVGTWVFVKVALLFIGIGSFMLQGTILQPSIVLNRLKNIFSKNRGVLVGPLPHDLPFPVFCSPLGTPEKPGSTTVRRVIVDSSYPKGKGVNSYIPKHVDRGNVVRTKLPTIDTIVQMVRNAKSKYPHS